MMGLGLPDAAVVVHLLLASSSVPPEGQEAVAAVVNRAAAADEAPAVELGVAAGSGPPSVGFRLSRRIAPQGQFDFWFDWADFGSGPKYADQTLAVYSVLLRRRLETYSDATATVFVTAGLTGWMARTIRPRREVRSPDGLVHIERRFGVGIVPPLLPTFGLGVQRGAGRRPTLRADAQVLVAWFEGTRAAPRFSGGVTIPLGGVRDP